MTVDFEASGGLRSSGLLTDLYELTMMQGYQHFGKDEPVVFDVFFRTQPFKGGYSVFAGLEDVLALLSNLGFTDGDIAWLSELGIFRDEFLKGLEGFKFQGDVYSMPEGSMVFPGEPIMRIHAPLSQAQLMETIVLNTVNFQSLVATKAARIFNASRQGSVLEMGMRRAQGPDGALSASRASYIGGASGTSNTYAGKLFGIPVRGTMAHSWVMTFDTEYEAFERYAELYPDGCIFLVDTYDTLRSGIENAIAVGATLADGGHNFGIRLDSGDLYYLSMKCRKRLDEAGFPDAKIAVSNELDERVIHQLVSDGAPIDLWGVGTHMVTGGDQASFPGVYKLSARTVRGTLEPVMKVSDTPEKASNPGIKQVYRFYDEGDEPLADLICLADDPPDRGEPIEFYHPSSDRQHFTMQNYGRFEPLLSKVMENGTICTRLPSLPEIREHAVAELRHLDTTYKRIINPHIYKVSLASSLKQLKTEMQERVR